ncbi:hypothetical protein EYF80_002382 [Liparis tanakae]|uniref:Uncharacterized protein n=1 Tax=Liparis tanakae TaxID=230148 RepID=A0A4Z2JAP1_9TELE|nr:hypothetical protein EYF80_002382 [Liparis tanakae]
MCRGAGPDNGPAELLPTNTIEWWDEAAVWGPRFLGSVGVELPDSHRLFLQTDLRDWDHSDIVWMDVAASQCPTSVDVLVNKRFLWRTSSPSGSNWICRESNQVLENGDGTKLPGEDVTL